MFITPAHAQGLGGGSDALVQMVPIALMFVIFYFLLIRPQQQKAKLHQDMVGKLRRGDSVILAGGIVGKVNRVRDGDPEIDVEIAKDTIVKVIRASVSEVRTKGEPVSNQSRPKSSSVTAPSEKPVSTVETPIVNADFTDVPDAEKAPHLKKRDQGLIGRLLGRN